MQTYADDVASRRQFKRRVRLIIESLGKYRITDFRCNEENTAYAIGKRRYLIPPVTILNWQL